MDKRYDFESRGISIIVKDSHDNIFIIKDINDKSLYGNLGMYSIFSYDSQFSLKYYYNIPLNVITGSDVCEHQKWVINKWDEFCILKNIKLSGQPKWTKYTSVKKATVYPKNKCELIDFIEWLKICKE